MWIGRSIYIEDTVGQQPNPHWHTLLWVGRSIYIENTVDRQPSNCGSASIPYCGLAASPLAYPIVGQQASAQAYPIVGRQASPLAYPIVGQQVYPIVGQQPLHWYTLLWVGKHTLLWVGKPLHWHTLLWPTVIGQASPLVYPIKGQQAYPIVGQQPLHWSYPNCGLASIPIICGLSPSNGGSFSHP